MTELKAIQLDSLLDELNRIQGQQVALQDAIENDKAIVIHPRREVPALIRPPTGQWALGISDIFFSLIST